MGQPQIRLHRDIEQYVHLWAGLDRSRLTRWNSLDRHRFWIGSVISMGYWTRISGGTGASWPRKTSQRGNGAHYRSWIQDAGSDHRHPAGLLGLAVLPVKLFRNPSAVTGGTAYNDVLPLMLARYCGPGSSALELPR